MKKREGYRAVCLPVAEVLLAKLEEKAATARRSVTALLNEALRVSLDVGEEEMPQRVKPGPKPVPPPQPKKGKKT